MTVAPTVSWPIVNTLGSRLGVLASMKMLASGRMRRQMADVCLLKQSVPRSVCAPPSCARVRPVGAVDACTHLFHRSRETYR